MINIQGFQGAPAYESRQEEGFDTQTSHLGGLSPESYHLSFKLSFICSSYNSLDLTLHVDHS